MLESRLQPKSKGFEPFEVKQNHAITQHFNRTYLFKTPMPVALNKLIPEFEAKATGGGVVTQTSHRGQWLILYFYPKDNTPGCTTESEQFAEQHAQLVQSGAVVFGVSRDNMASHDEFKTKLKLPFELIADTEEKMCHMFGVVKNKLMYGRKVKGIERSTFIIDPDGYLRHEWRGVKVLGHVEEVLQQLMIFQQKQEA